LEPGVPPQGEALRKAIRWVSDRRQLEPQAKLAQIIDEAALRFDLTPLETEFLWQALRKPAVPA